MAYRRSLYTRATLTARACNPSFSYILRDHDRKEHSPERSLSQREIRNFIQRRSFGSGFNNSYGLRNSLGLSAGSAFVRYMSSTVGEGSDKFELMTDVTDVLSDATTQVVANNAPAVNEVAIAAADSFFPVAALQHVIDAVHNFTGLNWWASIVVTALLFRIATFPLLIEELKAISKLTLMRPHLEEIFKQFIYQGVDLKAMDLEAVIDCHKQLLRLLMESGMYIQLIRQFIQGAAFVSFFMAISNMAEKVPSFINGGAFWFTDLTTPDSFYIFPILTGLSFLITVEVLVFNFLAILCFWITSNLFSLMYNLVLKVPGFKKVMGIPDITVPPPTNSWFSAIKRVLEAKAAEQASALLPAEPPKGTDQRISSNAVLSPRPKRLEKQVKGRKKNKKR